MIYICIPTHNEERTIGVLLWKIRQVMAEFPRDYQIIVADDASTDSTADLLGSYARVLPLTVIRISRQRGYAVTLEILLREAVKRSRYPKRDIIVTLQADFSEEPEEIPGFVKRIEGGADVVTTSVRMTKEDAPRAIRWTRTALGAILRRTRWSGAVSDPLSGFRAYRVMSLKKAMDECQEGRPLMAWQGWAANAALLRAVLPHARRVDEARVELRFGRRQRQTRFDPWETGKEIFRFLRGRPGAMDLEQVNGNGGESGVILPPVPLAGRIREAEPERGRPGRVSGRGRPPAAARSAFSDDEPRRRGADSEPRPERESGRLRRGAEAEPRPERETARRRVPAPVSDEQPAHRERAEGGRGRRPRREDTATSPEPALDEIAAEGAGAAGAAGAEPPRQRARAPRPPKERRPPESDVLDLFTSDAGSEAEGEAGTGIEAGVGAGGESEAGGPPRRRRPRRPRRRSKSVEGGPEGSGPDDDGPGDTGPEGAGPEGAGPPARASRSTRGQPRGDASTEGAAVGESDGGEPQDGAVRPPRRRRGRRGRRGGSRTSPGEQGIGEEQGDASGPVPDDA